MQRSVVMAAMRRRFMNENPAMTLARRKRSTPPATMSGSFVVLNARILVYTAVETKEIRISTVMRDVGGIKYIMESARTHKMAGRNRYCNFICHLL